MGKNSVISLYDYDEYGKLVKADNGKYGLVHANCAIQGTIGQTCLTAITLELLHE